MCQVAQVPGLMYPDAGPDGADIEAKGLRSCALPIATILLFNSERDCSETKTCHGGGGRGKVLDSNQD